jgi:hypothetical protein
MSKRKQTLSENLAIAARLAEYAELLEQQGADGFRERAYRNAAREISEFKVPLSETLKNKGRDGLVVLPAIGKGIAAAIAEIILTGKWSQLDRARGELVPEKLFMTIPGIGPRFAKAMVEDAHLESLEDLEYAIHTNEPPIKELGPRRREAIAAILEKRLGRFVFPKPAASQLPPVELILEVDAMYRARAAAGTLKLIAPKRHNPEGVKWLPIMHARHDDWHFTALFSNTALAHKLDKTNDWVAIYHENKNYVETRSTVVSQAHGSMETHRIVRGREKECNEFYVRKNSTSMTSFGLKSLSPENE